MTDSDIIDILIGLVMASFGFTIKYMTGRIKDNEVKIDDLRVDIAKQGQENQELYKNIERIDRNLQEIYKKLDDLIITIRTKNWWKKKDVVPLGVNVIIPRPARN